jgi:hypothetical protein
MLVLTTTTIRQKCAAVLSAVVQHAKLIVTEKILIGKYDTHGKLSDRMENAAPEFCKGSF